MNSYFLLLMILVSSKALVPLNRGSARWMGMTDNRKMLDTIAAPLEHLLEVSKSKFIAAAIPIANPEEALAWVDKKRAEHPKASHWCWAYAFDGGNTRYSDDGEPSGSAGRPILQAIEGEGLESVAVVVTRYYGGTKLGTGGLARAYGGSAREALRMCERVVRIQHSTVSIKASPSEIAQVYNIISKVEAPLYGQPGISFTKQQEDYDASGAATLIWRLPASVVPQLQKLLPWTCEVKVQQS